MKLWLACGVLMVIATSAWGKEDPSKPYAGSVSMALSPAEAQKRFQVPPGFEVRLFAAEPDVINPVAMSFDEKGRLWVVELYEYPYEKPKDEKRKGRDRVICLEDPDGVGHATKRTVVVEDLWLATAITYGNGGIYVGQAPDMYFYPIEQTPDGPKAGKRKTLLTGFGLDDKHELLNGFCWGPDGWLYMTEGVFTHSKVRHPDKPDEKPIPFDAGVGRYNPYTEQFEVWADGISNQWGIDWDAAGNAFVSACVIDHIWHVVPGGVYVRQGGVPNVPYTYGLLPAINKDKHRHHMAAYSGINIYQGDLFPPEYRGNAFMGNIHGNCIDRDQLTPDGSSFTATDLRAKTDQGEFLEANDDWFRPVSTQTGPDGALWIMDWYDKYPCYQNSHAPDLDRERGRIWRVVYVGKDKGKAIATHPKKMDLSELSDEKLVALFKHTNIWQRRTAERLLGERGHAHWGGRIGNMPMDQMLWDFVAKETGADARFAALCTLGNVATETDEKAFGQIAKDNDPAVRAALARSASLWGIPQMGDFHGLEQLASDPNPSVLAAVASTAIRNSASDTMPVIKTLLQQKAMDTDPHLPFLLWRAMEPKIAEAGDRPYAAEILGDIAGKVPHSPAAAGLVRKIIHRLLDTKDAARLGVAVDFINRLDDAHAELAMAAIQGVLDAEMSKAMVAKGVASLDLAKLQGSANAPLAAIASRLAAKWGNAAAAAKSLALIVDPKSTNDERIQAIRLAREFDSDAARATLGDVIAGKFEPPVKLEAIRALGQIGTDASSDAVIGAWASLNPDTRRAAAEVLTGRLTWIKSLLKAIDDKRIAAGDISALAIRTISQQKDEGVQVMFRKTIGRYRPSDADKLALIALKKKIMTDGSKIDYEAGHQLAQKTCLVCHSFYGEGMHVGPDLTGVGRSSIDALLHNVIDPNEIIGAGYENTIVETKDHRNVAGRLVESTDDHVKLLSAGDKEDVVPKGNIESIRTEKISVMPEGLVDTMPDADLRNLLWYIFSPPQEHGAKSH